MNKLLNISQKEIFSIGLILILALSRLIPHPPNFTPIIAVAVMSSYFFRNIYGSVIVLVISMVLSDIFIGFHKNILFVYFPLIIIIFIFFKKSHKINYKNLFMFGFFASLIFYLVSNFGEWALGDLYEKNLNGLINCYILAIPFFKNTLFSTVFYCYIGLFFGLIIDKFVLKYEALNK